MIRFWTAASGGSSHRLPRAPRAPLSVKSLHRVEVDLFRESRSRNGRRKTAESNLGRHGKSLDNRASLPTHLTEPSRDACVWLHPLTRREPLPCTAPSSVLVLGPSRNGQRKKRRERSDVDRGSGDEIQHAGGWISPRHAAISRSPAPPMMVVQEAENCDFWGRDDVACWPLPVAAGCRRAS